MGSQGKLRTGNNALVVGTYYLADKGKQEGHQDTMLMLVSMTKSLAVMLTYDMCAVIAVD